ncbi:oxidoreductase [Fusarium coicis]|nr:oxidoreductase [Fusarium coicis]
MTQIQSSSDPETLHLPRILCLHGGGVNAQVFELQCRALIRSLASSLRLVFMQAPFISAPHPDIVSVYGEYGPFRRWLRWQPDHPEIEAEAAAELLRNQTRRAMDTDPGTGEWIGILGFSQGAKIAASLLWTQQKVTEQFGADEALTQFKFGVLMAGRAPLITLDARLQHPPAVVDAALLSSEFKDFPESNVGDHVLSIPTLHVHGLRDPGLEQHQILLKTYCATGTTTLVEWDGGHRIPIKSHDVDAVTTEIMKLAKNAGIKLPN